MNFLAYQLVFINSDFYPACSLGLSPASRKDKERKTKMLIAQVHGSTASDSSKLP